MVSLESIKKYLRITDDTDDEILKGLIKTGEELIEDTLRSGEANIKKRDTAIIYCIAYLYEHREDADFDELTKNVRYLLMPDRKAEF